jgi:hypothetical protein
MGVRSCGVAFQRSLASRRLKGLSARGIQHLRNRAWCTKYERYDTELLMVNLKCASEVAIHNYLSFGIYNTSKHILAMLRFLLLTFCPSPKLSRILALDDLLQYGNKI